jgi:hypothetical protein
VGRAPLARDHARPVGRQPPRQKTHVRASTRRASAVRS